MFISGLVTHHLNVLEPLRQENAETHATMLGLILTCCFAEEQLDILLQHSISSVNQFEHTWWLKVGPEKVVPPSLSCWLPMALGWNEIC